MLRIGVELPDELPGTGEFVADAQALDAAGADTLWVRAAGLDPWPRLGALAAVTYRTRLGLLDLDPSAWSADALRSLLATVARLARKGLAVGVPDDDAAARLRPATPEGVALVRVGGSGSGDERWARVAAPKDRAEWRETRAAHEKAGATGVIVPMNERLLDLLRNPEQDDDRSDLQIAVG